MIKLAFIIFFLFGLCANASENTCVGRVVNPITEICWSCIFPISIGPTVVAGNNMGDIENPSNPICSCPGVPPRIGVTVGFWEPVYLVDVTRTPYCMVGMGGFSLASKFTQKGTNANTAPLDHSAFYHVHLYTYPLLYWMQVLTDFACMEKGGFDLAYMSELDPTWDDDDLAFLIHPEASLFGNYMSQAACGLDCGASTVGFPTDKFFWCSGCQGSMYPFNGNVSGHVGGVQSSKLVATRAIAKLHRLGMMWITSGEAAVCQKYPSPIIKKSQYKLQMTYPVAETDGLTDGCKPIGRQNLLDSVGKEFPYKGEDWGYVIWRKRNCCAF